MNKSIERHIKRRITIISRGRSGDRHSLQEHILAAAEDLAGDSEVDKTHIEQAFDSLGTSTEIREAFFPRKERAVPTWAILTFAAATLLAALDAFSSKSAICRGGDDGPVRCLVTAGDGLTVSLLSVMPPLVVLAAHFVGPKWLSTALAVAWLLLFVIPTTIDTGLARNAGLMVAGLVTTISAAVIWRQGATA